MRSTLGHQNYSQHRNSPSWQMGTSTREMQNKVFISRAHAKISTNGKSTPAPQYCLTGSVGRQVEGSRDSSPQWRIGTAPRFTNRDHRSIGPGPAAHDNSVSAVGRQRTSIKPSSPTFGFGSSNRHIESKRFISSLHGTVNYGSVGPGPMTSSHSIDTTGRRSGFGTADRFNCASGARGAEPLSPGPAAYDVKMSSVGAQTFNSSMVSQPAVGLGGAGRSEFSRVFISHMHRVSSPDMSPGPASINNAFSSIGKQPHMRGRSAPTWGFSKAERFPPLRLTNSPGPGSYSP